MKDRPKTLVQEDNAPIYASYYQKEVYNLWQIIKMIKLANLPNLNVIKPIWFYIKKETSKHRAISNRKKLRVR
jgi:hypothetical protein